MNLKNKIFLIVACIFLLIGVFLIIFGYYMIGADIIGWFTSRYAIWVYVSSAIFLFAWLATNIFDKIKRL